MTDTLNKSFKENLEQQQLRLRLYVSGICMVQSEMRRSRKEVKSKAGEVGMR